MPPLRSLICEMVKLRGGGMIAVRFSADGPRYQLPGYDDEEEYARTILSAMTGLSVEKLIRADVTASEFKLIEAASRAIRYMPLVAGSVPKRPRLEVVR